MHRLRGGGVVRNFSSPLHTLLLPSLPSWHQIHLQESSSSNAGEINRSNMGSQIAKAGFKTKVNIILVFNPPT